MPFIRGRYHINPMAGEALEAAREVEAALLASHQPDQEKEDAESELPSAKPHTGPIHRIEIETAEVVPAHSGRGQSGFVARVHRSGYVEPAAGSDDSAADPFEDSSIINPSSRARSERAGISSKAETRVFSNYQELVDFLRDELAAHCEH